MLKRKYDIIFSWRHFSTRSRFYCIDGLGVVRGLYKKKIRIFSGSVFSKICFFDIAHNQSLWPWPLTWTSPKNSVPTRSQMQFMCVIWWHLNMICGLQMANRYSISIGFFACMCHHVGLCASFYLWFCAHGIDIKRGTVVGSYRVTPH